MIDLYTWTTPNGRKVSIMLEEAGLAYTVKPVNIRQNEQFHPDFLKVSPNNKIPAIVDHATGASVFESGAILIYLAEKSGMFLPQAPAQRAAVLEWLMWQMSGVGPIFGQLFHFTSYAPEKVPYAIERFGAEAARLVKVMNTQLGAHEYVAGQYSIADMALYPWVAAAVPMIKQARAELGGQTAHVERWIAQVGARAAVQRGMAVPQV